MCLLGIYYYYHDATAAMLMDGKPCARGAYENSPIMIAQIVGREGEGR